jgi:UDP-N-acetylmuramoyl-tripeptide--D-alanyl-D-alanine ligase
VCTDSRKVIKDSLFLPGGERFDGHDFIDAALDAGAAGCLCARVPERLRRIRFYIQVADTRLALRALASAYRDRFPIPFVQITGSVGKDHHQGDDRRRIGAKLRVLKTPENFNNDIGTPLTLLGLRRSIRRR